MMFLFHPILRNYFLPVDIMEIIKVLNGRRNRLQTHEI
jgi:hypothetical protein